MSKNYWLALSFILAGLTGFYWGQGTSAPTGSADLLSALSGTSPANSKPFVADDRVKAADCIINGAYPDHECTPGAVFPNVTTTQTCVAGYTKTVRNVSVSLKKQVYQEYGIPYPPTFGSYEADHFIPLTLGGSNEIGNLFPEAAAPKPGFREKDIVENYLHEQVCDGHILLPAAQRAIATDWLAVYKSMSPSDIARLKAKYADWSKTGD